MPVGSFDAPFGRGKPGMRGRLGMRGMGFDGVRLSGVSGCCSGARGMPGMLGIDGIDGIVGRLGIFGMRGKPGMGPPRRLPMPRNSSLINRVKSSICLSDGPPRLEPQLQLQLHCGRCCGPKNGLRIEYPLRLFISFESFTSLLLALVSGSFSAMRSAIAAASSSLHSTPVAASSASKSSYAY